MEITSGRKQRGKKVVIYGPEGIGKSTFAAAFPDPLFIDTEGSTYEMDVRRFKEPPSSWTLLKTQVQYVLAHPNCCKTLCIDTADWAEHLCSNEICASHKVAGIEDFGYGKGYTFLAEEFGRLLNALEDATNMGLNVCITAHSQMRKFELPDATGAFDRYELKLSKQCTALLKEWADALFFANFKVTIITTKEKTKKGVGGERVMYTTHHPCWDAKNRWGLPNEIPFAFRSIAPFINAGSALPQSVLAPVPTTPQEPMPAAAPDIAERKIPDIGNPPTEKTETGNPVSAAPKQNSTPSAVKIPEKVAALMQGETITEEEIRDVVYRKGYYPYEMPIAEYPQDFIDGWIIPFFPKIMEMASGTLPF